MPHPLVVSTTCTDPYQNLAREEVFLESCPPDTIILYLWQNARTVVIGRNQNAWRECNTALLEAEDGRLSRRITGGGAVWHDTGNLNFSFIASAGLFDIHRQVGVILSALNSLGFPASFSGRNDIVAEDGRKFSGNAFAHRKHASLHHGTLLIRADMENLMRYLNVSPDKLSSKGIQSVRSRVCNISERLPDITLEQIKSSLEQAFADEYGKPSYGREVDEERVHELARRNVSWEWIYGSSPTCSARFETRFPWGGLEVEFCVDNGLVTEAQVFSDAMDPDIISSIPAALHRARFTPAALSNQVSELNKAFGSDILVDVARWLGQLDI